MSDENWDVIASSEISQTNATMDVTVTVRVPYAFVMSMAPQDVQHRIIDHIERRLRDYVDAEFQTKRLR